VKPPRTRFIGLLLIVAGIVQPGCNTFGPASIASGRAVYNEVINQTESEQLLGMIVRERYDDTYGMLAVTSVTANISVSASLGGQAGIGTSSNYEGNLVPLSAGVAYEENPTISYVPLGGADFLVRMLTPLSFREGFAAFESYKGGKGKMVSAIVLRINGLDNPAYIPEGQGTEGFERAAELWDYLATDRTVQIRKTSEGDPFIVFRAFEPADVAAANELLKLLHIEKSLRSGDHLDVPVTVGSGDPGTQAINLDYGSALDFIRTAGFCIDVPEEHLEANVVTPSGGKGVADFMHIRTSRKRPDDAAVMIRYRGWWYYISDSDPLSKQGFAILRTLIGLRLQETGSKQSAPVLTIPVG
jgi:hypothetical protein